MQTITIVQDYVWALVKRAQIERLEEGGVAATVPEAPGVVASGDDLRECVDDLIKRLESWVNVGLEKRWRLPVVDDIDLNSEQGQALAAWHPGAARPIRGEFYANEAELKAAFDRHTDVA